MSKIKEFVPNPELLAFAEKFSNNYLELGAGDYFSANKNYHILYLTKIPDYNSGARINNDSGTIELDKTVFSGKEFSADFLFFIILWCAAFREEGIPDAPTTDLRVMEYYITKTERSRQNLIKGFIKLLESSDVEGTVERINAVVKEKEASRDSGFSKPAA